MTSDVPSDPRRNELAPVSPELSELEFDEANRVPPPSGGLAKLKTTTERRESTRTFLACWLLALLSAIVVVGLYGWATGASRDRLEDLALMYSPIITLMATVLGFYFASQD